MNALSAASSKSLVANFAWLTCREFARENVGFDLNPWLKLHPHGVSLQTGESRATRKSVRNVADTGAGDEGRCCQQDSHPKLGQKGSGSPLSTLFELSLKIS